MFVLVTPVGLHFLKPLKQLESSIVIFKNTHIMCRSAMFVSKSLHVSTSDYVLNLHADIYGTHFQKVETPHQSIKKYFSQNNIRFCNSFI